MNITIKASNVAPLSVEVTSTDTILELKQKVADKLGVPPNQNRLIYKGRIAKDGETLGTLGVQDGQCFHMVKTASAVSTTTPGESGGQPAPAAPAAPTAPTGAFNPFAGGPAAADAFGGGADFMNPQMIGQMLQNPMVQRMMNEMASNPEILRNVMQNNPLIQSVANNNPMMREALNNPDVLRQFTSPDAMRAAADVYAQGGVPAGMPGGLAGGAGGMPAGGTSAARPPPGGMPDLTALLGGGGAGQPNMADLLGMLGQTNSAPAAGNGGFAEQMARTMQDPAFQQQMNQMMQAFGMGGGPAAAPASTDTRPARERFSEQLKQLEDMGFPDQEANLNALNMTGGEINAAISYLLERGFGN